MTKLNGFSSITSQAIAKAASAYGTPIYLYDEKLIKAKCQALISMPNAYGLTVRYAMKANPNRSLLRLIECQGLELDASSLNEVRRAHLAGISYDKIVLTSQETPLLEDQQDMKQMMREGLLYNVCSLRQLELIADFAAAEKVSLSMRIHPGIGSGETATRNTGDHYSCFGVHLSDLEQAMQLSKEKGVVFSQMHAHIGSGADPLIWKSNIDLELDILEKYFPDAVSISFGGGLKEARMPDESSADITYLGEYAAKQLQAFYEKTGRKLHMEIEPGTYVVANAGYAITTIMDKKQTGEDGLSFLVLNGGMEINTRPLLYASRHPFYVVNKAGELISSEFTIADDPGYNGYEAVVMGPCCESGDSQTINEEGVNIPRAIGEPQIGDLLVIGGAGAYCSAMSPMNYNSHVQIAEVLYTDEEDFIEIRKKQTLEQIVANEI